LFERDSAPQLLAGNGTSSPSIEAALSHPAREILTALESRGASFFNDLVRSTGRLPSEIEDGLWELVAAGLVTADGFENLRALTDPKRRRGEGRGRTARPRHAAGRWTLLTEARDNSLVFPNTNEAPATTDISEQAPAVSQQEALETHVRRLLNRWGAIFRDLLRRESLAPAWRDLLVVLRRMESRGEIRGGRFVQAFIGEQFALPDALELLRAVRRQEPAAEEVQLSASDPLNLTGIILPGDRVAASANETITLVNGAPRLDHVSASIPAAYRQ
jgi:ATP-dependent Lhr-like helicase